MNENKQLERECKKIINSVAVIIKKDFAKNIEKTLVKLKEKMSVLNIAELEQIKNDKNLLEKKYQECLKTKKETEKIFSNIKETQLTLTDINKDLECKKNEITNYMSQIEKCLKIDSNDKLSTMNLILSQNIQIIEENIKRNNDLAEKLSLSFGISLDTFKKYTDEIFLLKRKIYE